MKSIMISKPFLSLKPIDIAYMFIEFLNFDIGV